MILHGAERVKAELKRLIPDEGRLDHGAQTADYGIELIASLERSNGPEKWIEYGGHLALRFFHIDPQDHWRDYKRTLHQVGVKPFAQSVLRFFEISYLLPKRHQPWKWASAVAENVPDATAMILDAFNRCEQNDDNLWEQFELSKR